MLMNRRPTAKIIAVISLGALSILTYGCGDIKQADNMNTGQEPASIEQEAEVEEPERPVEEEPGEQLGEESEGILIDETTPRKYDMGDIDGNGESEYVYITLVDDPTSEYEGHLDFYFNEELIYAYEDILYMSPGEATYIDLDNDDKEEIFLTFYPHVNSMPLVEYVVLKQEEGNWKPLEMPHGETMLDNAFPISITCGEKQNTIVISCDGYDGQITYDFTEHYEQQIAEMEEAGMEEFARIYSDILKGDGYTAGDSFGNVAPWGIWEIKVGECAGANCLVATHGIEGYDSKMDMLGEVDVYFNYNSGVDGQVRVWMLKFRDYAVEQAMSGKDPIHPQYDALIEEARNVLKNGEEDTTQEEHFSYLFYANWYYETLGYRLVDLDNNGMDELIFGENGEDYWNGIIYDLYTISGDGLIHVLDGWERNLYYLCENGCIANEWSG